MHRVAQSDEQALASDYWDDHDLVFCQPTGRPIDATADARDWRDLLATAGVRRARLHDARHTTATLLLVQGVDPRTVMDVMG